MDEIDHLKSQHRTYAQHTEADEREISVLQKQLTEEWDNVKEEIGLTAVTREWRH